MLLCIYRGGNFGYSAGVIREDRIRELCAQLLRAQNLEVIENVAFQLQTCIDEYVHDAQNAQGEIKPDLVA